jgi:hypothetical protein
MLIFSGNIGSKGKLANKRNEAGQLCGLASRIQLSLLIVCMHATKGKMIAKLKTKST